MAALCRLKRGTCDRQDQTWEGYQGDAGHGRRGPSHRPPVGEANRHEVKLAVPALQTVRVPRRGRGRPRQRPKELVADKAYDSKSFRDWLRSRGIKPTIPPYQRRERKRPKKGRPVKAGSGYQERW